MIRRLLLAAALLAASPAWASDEDAVVTAINRFNDAMTRGDMKAASADYTASPVIIDEFAPHLWSGPNAVAQWGQDFGVFAKAEQWSEPAIVFDKPAHVTVESDHAYAVMPSMLNFKRKGQPVHEAGLMTFAMRKVGGAWKIAGWSWATK